VRAQERLAQPLGFTFGDHAAAPRGDRHGASTPQDLQLHRRALDTRDAQGHPPVVDLVVAVVLQQRVGYLRQAKSLLSIYDQRHDGDPVERGLADLVGFEGAGAREALRVLLGRRGGVGVPSR